MTVKQEEYSFYYKVKNESARKRLGFKAGFFWCTAKKQSLALSRGELAMDAAGFDEADFAKPVRVNMPIENDLPPEGVFDIKFCENREIGADGKTLVLIPGAASASTSDEEAEEVASTTETDDVTTTDTEADELPAYAYNVNGEPMADIEKEMSQPVSGLALPLRYLAQCETDSVQHQITPERLKELHSLEMDPDSRTGSILLALQNRKAQLEKLDTKNLHSLASYIGKVFPADKQPQLNDLINFIDAVFNTDYVDRGLLVKEWLKGNRVSCIQRTDTGTNAGGGIPTDRNPDLVHTLDTLDEEAACFLQPYDFNIYNIPVGVHRRAKSMIAGKESPWKEWSAVFRKTAAILDFSRGTIFVVIHNAPSGIHESPVKLLEYVNKNLVEIDFIPDDGSATDEERMEVVRRYLNPVKAENDEEKPQSEDVLADEPATAETVEPDTTERHQDTQSPDSTLPVESDKTPREQFSEQLAAERGDFVPGISDPDDPKWVRDDYSASNEGEKTEVAADDAADTADYINHSEEFSSQSEPETNRSEPVADQNEPETPETEPEPQSHVPDDIQPGIYFGVTNEAYHAGPGVSKSQLDDIAVCPAFYQWRKSAPVDTEKTKALDMGTALHCRLLEPDEFKKRFIIAPEFNRRTTAGKEEEKAFLESCENSGKTVMTSEEGRKLELMYGSVMAHPGCRALLEAEGKTESSIYWTDTETGELCRIRPDKFLTNSPLILDVKKVADMSRFARHVEEFRYHVQAVMYCEGWKAYSGETPRFAFLAVSESIDCGKYPVHLYILEDEHHDIGYSLFRRDLNTYHKCKSSNKWGWGFEIIERPYWARG
ncbi:exonuclease VIII [Salmonella enterica subsp. enterica]|nr:exonuclease VIII [Salmonella enterica subsp. enterica]